ncbi:MAG TPA: alpha-glucosidase/alpha-galactosidase [Candidatus Limiplasma sp.]|nr:alpha-glucosidase/alpha-galactosidase [Candidatus Limiplasma sp.]HRX08417.1 alpha-glucosidase/alpha-galactosidase [Candidatus Limiplasma sp.]
MKIDNGCAKELKIAYIGGGSRGWAWGLMSDLAMEESLSGKVHLYDIDQEAADRNEAIGNSLRGRGDVKGDWEYISSASRMEALKDADVVVISILPGTFDEMESDVHSPEQYGVYQPVGDTTGPGGLVRALRTGPMFQVIAEDIRTYCPNAFVINYTNPMALCIRVLYDTFPQIKAVGCCHEVFHTQSLLCKALAEFKGIENVTRQQLHTTVQGVNHFTFITQASYRDIDLFPVYREFVEKYAQNGYTEGSDDNWMNRFFDSAQMVKMDLYLRTGQIAAAGDRHLAEFNPAPRYLASPEKAHSYRFTLTPVSWRKQNQEMLMKKSARLFAGDEAFQLTPTGEEGVEMIKAFCGLRTLISNVNLPNKGQIPNLPLGTVVETNAVFSDHSVSPIHSGPMQGAAYALTLPAALAQDDILCAVKSKDASAALRAFAGDPLMVGVTLHDAKLLYRKMLNNTKVYLPGWKLDI